MEWTTRSIALICNATPNKLQGIHSPICLQDQIFLFFKQAGMVYIYYFIFIAFFSSLMHDNRQTRQQTR